MFANTTNYALLCSSDCIDAVCTCCFAPDGGGIRSDMGAYEYHYLMGDANCDGEIDIKDPVYLQYYLFRFGPPPCPLGKGDANCDSVVTIADIVYLINYIIKGGPPPGCNGSSDQCLSKVSTPVEISFGARSSKADGSFEIAVLTKCPVEIAAVQLEFTYDPNQIQLLDPSTTYPSADLQMYSSTGHGIQKIGLLDLKGDYVIPRGEVSIVTLRGNGKDVSSLHIAEAIIVDSKARTLFSTIGAKSESVSRTPLEFSVGQNYPNPFNPSTMIQYALPHDAEVNLLIYNVLGQKVKILVNEFQTAGFKSVEWDGKDDRGSVVATGIYFYKLKAGEFIQTKKMVMLK